MDLGPYATFIVAAYGAALVILAGVVAWLLFDGWRQRQALSDLERRGIRRRSAGGGGTEQP